MLLPSINQRVIDVENKLPLNIFKYLKKDEYSNIIHMVIYNTTIINYKDYIVKKPIIADVCYYKLLNLNKQTYIHAIAVISIFSRRILHYLYNPGSNIVNRLLSKYTQNILV